MSGSLIIYSSTDGQTKIICEKIKNFSILEESFSAENNMLTPTLKMKRYIIKKNFENLLNSFYKKK